MPDKRLLALLDAYRRRFRLASLTSAAVLASACAGVAGVLATLASSWPVTPRVAGVTAFAVAGAVAGLWAWRQWTTPRVASELEARAKTFDNLVITAEEIASGRAQSPHPAVRDALFASAMERLCTSSPAAVQPMARHLVVATLCILAVFAFLVALPVSQHAVNGVVTASTGTEGQEGAPGDVRVIVTPPAYVRRQPTTAVNPTTVLALDGSRVQLQVMRPSGVVALREMDGREVPFATAADTASFEFTASASRPLVVRQMDDSGSVSDRLVYLRVQNDERPSVIIRDPAKDLMFAEAKGQVPVHIEARDDVALSSLALRYTRVSGSGETFTFEEGEWPINIERQGTGDWTARGVLALEALKLQDGDTLVYRAVARDSRPGADPAASDTYLIEIGRLAGVASTGFALPDDRERQAISQQMLIIKTERLHADRAKLSADAFLEQSQLLAVEQRMVKAEFVFMTGGEVEDEVEEATHAHELAEGRLENTGQSELLAAIREMSRAEARLNAADTRQALEFERAALKALQRAFDRRRYLLRTLPERARIDGSRRLTGELETARSSSLEGAAPPADPVVESARTVLQELSADAVSQGSLPQLASRILALDINSEQLQRAALAVSSATDGAEQSAARRDAQHVVGAFLRQRLAVQAPTTVKRDTLRGRVTQELPRRRTP